MGKENPFIIIKGDPKSLQIESIHREDNGVYNVKYLSSSNTYHYKSSDVVILCNGTWVDHLLCKVYINDKLTSCIDNIYSFQEGGKKHWRITFSNGASKEYMNGTIKVVTSCLCDATAKNSFEYLKRVAQINVLGKEEDQQGILASLYDGIDFIDNSLTIAPYLNPKIKQKKVNTPSSLIFPFGCNGSQEEAVRSAFSNQISVIQGPPGTGKTQTILNIVANVLLQGKTAMIVSNNNSATLNVLEKLEQYGMGFVVAPLGSKENKEKFIKNQPEIPNEIFQWIKEDFQIANLSSQVSSSLSLAKRIFKLQENVAKHKHELNEIELEWKHFQEDNPTEDYSIQVPSNVTSSKLMSLWLQYQAFAENDLNINKGIFAKIKGSIKWFLLNLIREKRLGIKSQLNRNDIGPTIREIQIIFYIVKIKELRECIDADESELRGIDSAATMKLLSSASMALLKNNLSKKYATITRRFFSDLKDLGRSANEVCEQYPIVLSTTFSARTTLRETVYDYLIIDEASQVSVETGALALTCARNAIIVGDQLQLPNVITEEDKGKLNTIFNEFKVADGYNSAENSFLQSVLAVVPNVKETLLREHYRCHPRIINFCNQKFYKGQLVIMTEDHHEENVMMAVKTVPGNHSRGLYNQREIDVVAQEVLPLLSGEESLGVITPYNAQVDAFHKQLPFIETATIHKYQGREKDSIIMSVVDDQITEFSDDPNLINVAISRAKKRFCIVLSGNEQLRKGVISELVDYINYNNFTVMESKISSIFDTLYQQYTQQRIAFISQSKRISEYESENITYQLISEIIEQCPEFHHLGVLCHIPIRNVIRDNTLMSEAEKKYVSHFSTHLDFLIINHVSKKPVLAIETDGYMYHKENTLQHQRDLMKDHILKIYGLPLLRLSTTGSRERERIIEKLIQSV